MRPLYGPEWTPEMKRKDRHEVGMVALNLLVLALLCVTGLIFIWLFFGGMAKAIERRRQLGDDDGWFFFWFW